MVRIEVIFDTACPWCYVGSRRLARTLQLRPHIAVHTVWRPFLLNPDVPEQGVPRGTYLERKFGSRSRIDRMLTAVTQAGASEGIRFDFGRIDRTPNTMLSHRLVAFAAEFGRQWQAVNAIFSAYFSEGADIGDSNVLSSLGESIGLPRPELEEALRRWPANSGDNARVHGLGINGVPCYIFDDTYAVAGAQEPDVLVRLLDLAHENYPEPAISGALLLP